ncbi:MAG: gliding motility-associated C-terminal domain-containing protein [Bacteroidetes bacterium]|nr:gliding motility-associated C-terminal domain-containing protein [Bacteroidota bacterium]
MKKKSIVKKLAFLLVALVLSATNANAQFEHPNVAPNYIFSADSIKGFDENAASAAILADDYVGDEYKVMMYYMKRDFVKAKYNLKTVEPIAPSTAKGGSPNSIAVANCVNEDFEEAGLVSAVPGTINVTLPTAINGWTVNSGSNTGANASCVYKTMTGNPNAVWVMSGGSTGLIDPVIGASYPIYSVYGNTTTSYPAATTLNGFQCFGDWFIKMNNNTGGYTAHRLKKNINVTPNNALFQFAFIAVLQSSHCCCTSGGFSIKVQLGCAPATTTLLGCPQFTATAPQTAGCPGGAMACSSPSVGNTVTYLPAATAGVSYNRWKQNTLDLTSYIGQCVTIEVEAFDCNAGGHYGYIYFDAQCSPMAIIGNGTSFPAGTPNITLPTCGTGNTATITAPPGVGPYLWAGPDPLVNGSTAQTVTTSVTGMYTLTMNPPGACLPIVRTVSVVISPAPNLAVSSQTQVSCTSTVNGLSLIMGSGSPNTSATPNYTVSFAPAMPTATVGQSATTGTYTGFPAGTTTVTITDMAGCIATQTVNFQAAPPIGSFSISAPSGTIIGCNPPSISLNAINTGTLTNMTYTWVSTTTGTATGSTWTGGAPSGTNVLTVIGADLGAGSCPTTQTIAIVQNTAVPTVSVNPITGNLTCNGAPATFTATSSTTVNIVGQWFAPPGVPVGGLSSTPLVGAFNAPGTYTVVFTNVANGCSNSQTVSVTSNSTIPTMSVTANLGYTITCSVPCVSLAIASSSTIAPISYSWTNVTTSVTTTPVNGGYSVCVPGTYVAGFKDGLGCTVTQTVNVMIDTARIFPTAITNLPSNSYTLTCTNNTLLATAISNPQLAANNYSWTVPPNLTTFTNQVVVNLSNITSSTSPTNYTVLATNPANGCVGRQRVQFYKDIFVPRYNAVFTPSAITCANSCVQLSPQLATGTSTIPITFTFTSPAPTFTNNIPGSTFCAPGTYTMDYTNSLNGCSSVTTCVVPLNVTFPSTVALAPVQIPCGQTTTIVTAGTTTTSNTYTYSWTPPENAGMGSPNGYSTTVNAPGVYEVVITNTVNGCSTTNSILVTSGSLDVSMTPNPASGYAPLNVGFSNTTPFTSSSGTMTTTWNYGNGITVSTTSLANTYTGSATPYPGGSNQYQTAGTYTVLLVMAQNVGTVSCVGTATALVVVDLPSELTVPNVFTPNGDGVNDSFTLLTTNLSEITFTVFDRWGVKMYDVKSESGNVSWDGKNFGGKEVPVGTYFYILKAKGADGKDYEDKGSISVYR